MSDPNDHTNDETLVHDSVSCTIYKIPSLINEYHVYFTDEIYGPDKYIKLEHILRTSRPCDKVNMYIGNGGGDCDGLIHIVNAMANCKSHISMRVVSPSCSAAATLALCGDDLVLENNTFLMFHNYSFSSESKKGLENLEYTVATDKWFKQYSQNLHSPFLSQREIDHINNDNDVYVWHNNTDLHLRLKRHFKNIEVRIGDEKVSKKCNKMQYVRSHNRVSSST